MTSTKDDPQRPISNWRASGERYYRIGPFFERLFGQKVWKVSVDAGFDCPNRDGTVGVGGCRFCDPASFSPSRRLSSTAGEKCNKSPASITSQIEHGMMRMEQRYSAERFLAYFQPGTNTYASLARLRACYEEALACPAIVGLIVGTRPDCLADEVLDLLAELARRTWVSVELGMQSMHDRSLDWLARGHHHDAFVDAVTRAHGHGLHVGAHVILGLPTETVEDMIATAKELTRLSIDMVKLHNLYVVKNTPLAEDYDAGLVGLPGFDQYVDYVVGFLEHLRPECVVDRLCGDAPSEYLVAPSWCSEKSVVRRAVEEELERRDTWQGKKLSDV